MKNQICYNPQADLPLCLKCNVLVPSLETEFIKVVRLPLIRGKQRKPLGTLSTNLRRGPALFPDPVEDEGVAEDSDDEPIPAAKGRSKRLRPLARTKQSFQISQSSGTRGISGEW